MKWHLAHHVNGLARPGDAVGESGSDDHKLTMIWRLWCVCVYRQCFRCSVVCGGRGRADHHFHARWFSDKLNVRGNGTRSSTLKSWDHHKLLRPSFTLPEPLRSVTPKLKSPNFIPEWRITDQTKSVSDLRHG